MLFNNPFKSRQGFARSFPIPHFIFKEVNIGMKTAIMYGGGNIGRGFIGKVFADSGYEVCFLDIMQDIIDAMNARGQYTVRIVSNEGEQDTVVKPVRAVNSLTGQAIELGTAAAACSLSEPGATEGMRTYEEAMALYRQLKQN